MADIAEIGFKADTRDLDEARKKLEAIKPAAAGAENAASSLSGEVKRTNGAFGEAASGAGKLGTAFARFTSGIIVSAFAGISLAIKGVYGEMVKLDNLARLTGESLTRLQQIQFAAGSVGVSGKDVQSGVRELALKAAEVLRTGEGDLKELFEANNLKLTDRNGKLKSINALLEDSARLFANAGSEADKIKIAELLGLSESWIRALENGPQSFRNMQDEAAKTGDIIDSALIQKAAEFDANWTKWTNSWATKFKATVADLIGWLDKLVNAANAAAANSLTKDNKWLFPDNMPESLKKRNEELLKNATKELEINKKIRAEGIAAIEAEKKRVESNFPSVDAPFPPTRPSGLGGSRTKIPGKDKGGGGDDTEKELTDLQKIAQGYKELSEPFNQATTAFNAAKSAMENGLISNEAYAASIAKIKDAYIAAGGTSEQFAKIASKGADDLGKQFQDLNEKSLKRVGDEFVEMAFKGKANFGDLAKSIIKDLVKIAIQALIVKPLLGMFGGLFKFGDGGLFGGASTAGFASPTQRAANGAAFGNGAGVTMFAGGGSFTNSIVNKATPFAYGGSNLGIMGEAGPEAIMPLKRGANGSLGVQLHGAGGQRQRPQNNVNVTNQYTISGAVSREEITAAIRASAEQTKEDTRKALVGHLDQYNRDGYL